MSSGSMDLGTNLLQGGGSPGGTASGDLSGNYPGPSVATVGGSAAADIHTSQLLTLASTSAATASTLVKRDTNSNAQFSAITMGHVSAGVDNVGMSCAASASANFPLLVQRDLSTPIVMQLSNPSVGGGTGCKKQVVTDNGNNSGEIGIFTSATVAPDAYAGGNMTLRSSGSTAGISIVADDVATYIKHYVGGNGAANLALQSKSDLTTISYGGVILSTSGSRPAAGASYRGMLWVAQGGAGVADKIQVCLKSSADTYSWKDIISG